ncbi:caffeoylshikimate esterase-like isoform X2 [Camellia sinensis]|uniref:caffeoylshikimate esterase-like isoform X2 n=1 Tax=Camellia sinensis TaxID=4442 RepID=UPI001035CEE0|nr:caffeoylshikimate esterase-like isoform X2 [Camellia sinensis]
MACEIEGVRYEEEFILNSRGVKLFTCRWLPANSEPKALIFLCHGYAMECSISMKGTGTRLAKAGFAVYGMDYEGHGKSSGLHGFVPCFDHLVTDCSDYYSSICERKENMNKLRIVLGESMGGAVALLLHRKKPTFWDGAILVAPMCKIADDMRPHPLVISVLTKLCRFIPTWKIIPAPDIVDVAFRDPQVREEVSLPFLVLHGSEDKVTDPSVSKLLYESACSTDKSFKLYPEMWHALTYGELPKNIDIVFSDIISWLDDKISITNSRLEHEQKLDNDDLLKAKDTLLETTLA